MTPSNAIRILTACGIILAGPVTSDALALARALEIGSSNALLLFAEDHPTSPFAVQAMKFARNPHESVVQIAALKTDLPQAIIGSRQNSLLKVQYGGAGNAGGVGGSQDRASSSTSRKGGTANLALERRAVADINAKVKRFKRDSQDCHGRPLSFARGCLADALVKLAQGLESAPRTRGGVAAQVAPAIRKAAKKLRAAKTVKQARAAVAPVVPVIRNSVDLIVAGDGEVAHRLQIQQRSLTLQAMTTADQVLAKAKGI